MAAGEVQLRVENVAKQFGGVTAVDGVSLEVREGEILSVIGPNGAGKTSLLNMVSGFYRPDRDRITFEGEEITNLPPYEIAERDDSDESFVTIHNRQSSHLDFAHVARDVLNLLILEAVKDFAAHHVADQRIWRFAFSDCTHGPEPDCAVKAAVADGRLDAERLASYHKLMRELQHRAAWEDKRAAAAEKAKVKVADRALQKRLKEKRDR